MAIEYVYNKELPIVKKGWKGNILLDGKFYNGNEKEKPPIWKALKWKTSRNPQKAEKANENYQVSTVPLVGFSKKEDSIVWLGHSSFLLTIDGLRFITDPNFYDILVLKRQVALPTDISNLIDIDYLLVSHDHRDHFDAKSVTKLIDQNTEMQALLPLGMRSNFIKNGFTKIKTQEAGWYQEYRMDENIRVIFLPAKHWGRRTPFDYNKVLWGSFLIITENKTIFFAGDTAYSNVFKDIHDEFGDIDICMLPIGAYMPRFIMAQSHTTPEEAYQIFQDLGGKTFIPMHYGTYDLSDEPLGEPIKRIRNKFEGDINSLKDVVVGEVLHI